MSRTVYRISRGFAFFKTVDEFAFEGLRGFGDKVVILIYPNSNSGVLEKKLARIMETFCTSLFQFKEGDQAQQEIKRGRQEYDEVVNLLELNEREMNHLLEGIKSRHCIENWRTFLWKEKLVYESLNKMQLRDHFLVADIYLPKNQKEKLVNRIGKIQPSPEFQ